MITEFNIARLVQRSSVDETTSFLMEVGKWYNMPLEHLIPASGPRSDLKRCIILTPFEPVFTDSGLVSAARSNRFVPAMITPIAPKSFSELLVYLENMKNIAKKAINCIFQQNENIKIISRKHEVELWQSYHLNKYEALDLHALYYCQHVTTMQFLIDDKPYTSYLGQNIDELKLVSGLQEEWIYLRQEYLNALIHE